MKLKIYLMHVTYLKLAQRTICAKHCRVYCRILGIYPNDRAAIGELWLTASVQHQEKVPNHTMLAWTMFKTTSTVSTEGASPLHHSEVKILLSWELSVYMHSIVRLGLSHFLMRKYWQSLMEYY